MDDHYDFKIGLLGRHSSSFGRNELAYAAGYASTLLNRLNAGEVLPSYEVEWLYDKTGRTRYVFGAAALCQQLIDAYNVQQFTEQLTR